MIKKFAAVCAAVVILPAIAVAQKPTAATYITDEQVKAVNATPGISADGSACASEPPIVPRLRT